MLQKLLLATKNRGKVKEIVPYLEGVVKQVTCLADFDNPADVEETEDTFEGNALLKAEALYAQYGIVTLADDSGLEVDALNGAPGVRSARFAGENATDEENNRKLIKEMSGVPAARRKCRFRCVMALSMQKSTRTFEGVVEGTLTERNRGDSGFGYDPLFIPAGCTKTFAELGVDVKKTLSHRTRALEQVVSFLKETLCP